MPELPEPTATETLLPTDTPSLADGDGGPLINGCLAG